MPKGNIRCRVVTWQEAFVLARDLARKVRASGYRPTVIVAIGRGGYVPARVVADYLLLSALTSIRIEHYGSAADKKEQTHICYPLVADVAGCDVLVVDDLTDTGETLALAADYVRSFGAREVRTAALQHKATSPCVPDYYIEFLSEWNWIVYPWALFEDAAGFTEKVLATRTKGVAEIREEVGSTYNLWLEEEMVIEALEALVGMGKARKTGDLYGKA
jgi:hypoxanthine phosphoribosyltransferase